MVFKILFPFFFVGLLSCIYKTSVDTSSENPQQSRRRADEPDNTPVCSTKDTCKDSCRDMFNLSSDRQSCYKLTENQVNHISKVDDVLKEDFSKNALNDIDLDHFELYLETGFDSFLEKAAGLFEDRQADDNLWSPSDKEENSIQFLKWLGKADNTAARIVLEYDKELKLGEALFKNLNISQLDSDPKKALIHTGSSNHIIYFHNTYKISSSASASNESSRFLEVSSDFFEFLGGFLAIEFDSLPYLSYTAHGRNRPAFEWVHNTVVEYCKNTTDTNERSVEVKTCLQIIYCLMRSYFDSRGGTFYSASQTPATRSSMRDGIFDDLNYYQELVGRTETSFCSVSELEDPSRMENRF